MRHQQIFGLGDVKGVTMVGVAIFVVTLVMGMAMGIASIVIWQQNKENPCVGTTDLVSFDYLHYLLITGVCIIAVNGVSILLVCCYGMATLVDFTFGEVASGALFVTLTLLNGFFTIAWYFVGAILYFSTIHLDCPSGQSLRDFGLAFFIIQTVAIACACCTASTTAITTTPTSIASII
jgi:hypothetical protein